LTPALTRGWAPAFGVLRARLKYIDLPLPELFDLASDPSEQTNLAARVPARRDEARALLVRMRSGDRGIERDSESAEVRERLAGLGYVATGGGLKAKYDESDDPKRNVAFETDLEAVIQRYVLGDVSGALAECERLVQAHPRVALGLRHLSFLRRKAGDLPGAVDAGRRALLADPGSAEAAAELGQLLNDLGQPQETARLLAPRTRGPEPDLAVLLAYGVALARAGQRQEALAALQKARQAYPASALAADSLGTALLMFGDRERASGELRAALQLDPGLARAYGSLGLLAAVGGSPREAVRLWTRALELDPRDVDSRLNLGTLLWREGRRAEATPHLRRFLSEAPPGGYAEDITRVRSLLGAQPPPRPAAGSPRG
jgi:tetratricopeptide (TPR) repeat protein